MARPTGFSYVSRKNGDVVISHNGRAVITLRGRNAVRFEERLRVSDPQEVMARAAGNYKRGNERTS